MASFCLDNTYDIEALAEVVDELSNSALSGVVSRYLHIAHFFVHCPVYQPIDVL